MTRPLNSSDDIAIAQLVVFTPLLFGGIYLCVKHGISKGPGGVYLAIFSLTRVIGSALGLATVSNPTNKGLYIGWQVLESLGLGPLILILLSLLDRMFQSISRHVHNAVRPIYRRALRLLIVLSVVLISVGFSNAATSVTSGGLLQIKLPAISKAGVAMLVAAVALLCVLTMYAARNQGYINRGEHRLLITVIVSLPFLVVRLVYSCLIVIGGATNTTGLYVGTAVVMEMIVTIVCLIGGLSVDKKPPRAGDAEAGVDLSRDRGPSAQRGHIGK